MAQGTVAQTFALQKEKVRPQLSLLYQLDDTLWGEIESRGDVEVVSSRPTRVPLELLAGGTFTTNSPDGGDLGLGSAPITDFMTLVPVYFFQCSQWTKQAEISTNANEKAIEDYSKLIMKRAMKNFRTYMEAVFSQGAGDNQLDTVVSTGTNVIYVHNANQFQDQQPIDIWTTTGGTFVGTVTVQSVDAANKALWLTGPVPGGTTAGYGLYVRGSAGVANSGLFGLFQYAYGQNSGTVAGLQRTSYPGKLIMPYVNGQSQTLTQSTARKLTAQMQIALGATAAYDLDLQFNMGPDMMAAWENLSLTVQRQDVANVRDMSGDMLPKRRVRTIGGLEAIVNERARPGYIDWIPLEHCFSIQSKALSLYDVKGQTVFPAYAQDGSVATSMLMYLVIMLQFCFVQPVQQAYLSAVNIPAKYFGH